MSDTPPLPPDPTGTLDDEAAFEALAAEHALGLLDPEEAAAARARMQADPAFAAEVRDWHERVAILLDEMPRQAPHYTVKSRIDAVLFAPPPSRKVGPRLWLGAALLVVLAVLAGILFWTGWAGRGG